MEFLGTTVELACSSYVPTTAMEDDRTTIASTRGLTACASYPRWTRSCTALIWGCIDATLTLKSIGHAT